MRFVAGRGAAAERLAGALQRRANGKMLLAVDTVTELLLAGAPWWLSCCWPGDATEQDAAGRGVAAELHREATSRAASAEDQATQRGSTEQQPTQKGCRQRAAKSSGQRRTPGGALNNHSRRNI